MICDCYCDELNWLGQKGKCKGTKEFEPCNCSGDKTKCNFYDYIRKQGLVEIGVSECTTVETLINVLKQYPKDMEVKVVIDRKVRPLAEVVLGFDLEKNKDYVWIVGKSNEM